MLGSVDKNSILLWLTQLFENNKSDGHIILHTGVLYYAVVLCNFGVLKRPERQGESGIEASEPRTTGIEPKVI